MKKGILIILGLLLTLCVFSQKLNKYGEKVVSSVIVAKYKPDGEMKTCVKITYEYDSQMNLKSVKYVSNEKSITITKQGDKLVSDAYMYTLNGYGLISSRESKNTINNEMIKEYTTFYYVFDGNMIVLKQIKRQTFVKNVGETRWSPSNDIDYMNFKYKDNNFYWRRMWSSDLGGNRTYYSGERNNNVKYSNVRNDVNVNLNTFLTKEHGMICIDEHEFELSTEWCGLFSENILDGYDFVFDENGNITEIVWNYDDGTPFRKVLVNYLY